MLTTLPPSCDDCLKIWQPQPPRTSGPVNACNGIAFRICIGMEFKVTIPVKIFSYNMFKDIHTAASLLPVSRTVVSYRPVKMHVAATSSFL
jgi:hypothetical protein